MEGVKLPKATRKKTQKYIGKDVYLMDLTFKTVYMGLMKMPAVKEERGLRMMMALMSG